MSKRVTRATSYNPTRPIAFLGEKVDAAKLQLPIQSLVCVSVDCPDDLIRYVWVAFSDNEQIFGARITHSGVPKQAFTERRDLH